MMNRNLSSEQHILMNKWMQYGAAAFCQKVRSGWTVTVANYTTPTTFRPKRAALAHADARVQAALKA